jgi:hypothetical protein
VNCLLGAFVSHRAERHRPDQSGYEHQGQDDPNKRNDDPSKNKDPDRQDQGHQGRDDKQRNPADADE